MAIFPGKAALLLSYSLSAAAGATGVLQLPLDEIADTALQRQASTAGGAQAIPYQSSSWLTGLPALGLSFLVSDEQEGTDEAELSLNLPFKSGYGRKLDQSLKSLAVDLRSAEKIRRRLYVSGLIRESLWSQRIEAVRASFSNKKVLALQDLAQRQQALFEAQSSSRYSLLRVQQELINARAQHQDYQWQAKIWQQRYRQITGLGSLPADISESALPEGVDYSQHPQLQLLALDWQRQQQMIAAGSNRATPWNVAITAKQLDSPLFDENQYGVAVEVPLSVFSVEREISRSEWQTASRSYWQAHDVMQLDIRRRWGDLLAEADYLLERQALLDESARISTQLIHESQALVGQNELAGAIWLRRLMDDIDNQSAAAINQILTGQNLAMTRQAAGVPL
jgi:hypothetical protein